MFLYLLLHRFCDCVNSVRNFVNGYVSACPVAQKYMDPQKQIYERRCVCSLLYRYLRICVFICSVMALSLYFDNIQIDTSISKCT